MYLGRRGWTGGPPSEVWSMTCKDGWASGMGWLAELPPPPPLLLLLLLLLLLTTGINLRSVAKMGSVAGTSFARHG